jgi:hypothetical protein
VLIPWSRVNLVLLVVLVVAAAVAVAAAAVVLSSSGNVIVSKRFVMYLLSPLVGSDAELSMNDDARCPTDANDR